MMKKMKHPIDDEERKMKNFMKDLPSEVSFRRPSSEEELWAFWSEPTLSPCGGGGGITDSATHTPATNQPIITDIIKSFLLRLDQSYCMGDLLIQFWAPITTETGGVQLVTSDQPFAISYHLDERLLKYRKHCLQYKFNVDEVEHLGILDEVEHLGIPGRVFRRKWHQCMPDVRLFSTKEYPQRDFALACDILETTSLPVFQTSFQECVGVLEFTATTNTNLDRTIEWYMKYKLQRAGLKTSFSILELLCKQNCDRDLNLVAEIRQGLGVVCKTHNLPFAYAWVPCRRCNGLAIDGSMDNSYHMTVWSCSLLDDKLRSFCPSSKYAFQKGQGVEVVRRAYLSHKLCFCRDITQFSITQYPDLPVARSYGLTGCFAICLQSTCAENYHYVL
ncbi:protein NLP6-like isoform X2 [Cornus florida]|uniref:protein NLP6-like isoform X2 n=1 Tax=Cornus florida TaxID=4283 RepID=UPI00289CC531|nr:protein NLP6-like isoform X2 [Cornus florida]